MNQAIKLILVFFSSIFLGIILAPLGGIIYTAIIGARCTPGLFLLESFDSKCTIEGFIYFYVLFISFFPFIFLKKKTAWIMWAISTLPVWMLYLLIIATENLRYQRNIYYGNLILIIIFWAVGLGASFIVNKIRDEKQSINL